MKLTQIYKPEFEGVVFLLISNWESKMLLLREMVIITLFIVGYNITTGCIPGTYIKFYIYRIAFIFLLGSFHHYLVFE